MSFSGGVDAFARHAGANMDRMVRRVVLEIGTRIVEKSPVGDADYWTSPAPPGYVGGRFRANWQYKFGYVPSGTIDAVSPSGSISIDSLSNVLVGPTSGVHFIANNLPYAKRLENGWSRQAPRGMVALTLVEFQGIVRRAPR